MVTLREEHEYRQLLAALREIDAILASSGGAHWDLAEQGSALDQDDVLLKPLNTSHLVGHCLAMAEDQLRAIRSLLTDHTGQHELSLPMAAHNANVRSALESSSLAIWLLSPEDRKIRVSRSLQSRQNELLHERALFQTLTETSPEDEPAVRKSNARQRQVLMKRIQAQKRLAAQVAERAGLDIGQLAPFPGFREIVGEASHFIGVRRSQGSGLWQALSGLAHPSALRQINMSQREVVSEDDDNLHVLFTASPVSVLAGVLAAVGHFKGAVSLTSLRGSHK